MSYYFHTLLMPICRFFDFYFSVKKAYYKLSLKVHPDRVNEEEKAIATEKFKVLGQIHSVLSKHKLQYDTDGTISDEDTENWFQYWNIIFKEITIQDIVEYERNYKGAYDNDINLNIDVISFCIFKDLN